MKQNLKKVAKAVILSFVFAGYSQTSNAQSFDGEYGFFDHLGAGVSLGTGGIGIDVATTLTDWGAIRAGVSFMPGIKYTKKDVEFNDPALYDKADIEGKLSFFDVKILADFYPFKTSSFHLTAGAYLGNDDPVTANGKIVKDKNVGVVLGDYRVTSYADGVVEADIKANTFKPYIGFGFGRAIPKKNRVSVSCDFGVKFWGKPGLGVATTKPVDQFGGDLSYHTFHYNELYDNDNKDFKDAIEIIEKIIVYPVLNVRICGRIF